MAGQIREKGSHIIIIHRKNIQIFLSSYSSSSSSRLGFEVRSSGYCSHSIVQIHKFLINVGISTLAYNAPSAIVFLCALIPKIMPKTFDTVFLFKLLP